MLMKNNYIEEEKRHVLRQEYFLCGLIDVQVHGVVKYFPVLPNTLNTRTTNISEYPVPSSRSFGSKLT